MHCCCCFSAQTPLPGGSLVLPWPPFRHGVHQSYGSGLLLSCSCSPWLSAAPPFGLPSPALPGLLPSLPPSLPLFPPPCLASFFHCQPLPLLLLPPPLHARLWLA